MKKVVYVRRHDHDESTASSSFSLRPLYPGGTLSPSLCGLHPGILVFPVFLVGLVSLVSLGDQGGPLVLLRLRVRRISVCQSSIVQERTGDRKRTPAAFQDQSV